MGAPIRVDCHSPPGGQTKGSSLWPKGLMTNVCAASRAILHSGCSVILAARCPRVFLGFSNYSPAPGPLSSIPTGWSILTEPSLFRSLPSTSFCLCFMPKEHLPADSYSGTPVPDSSSTQHSLDSRLILSAWTIAVVHGGLFPRTETFSLRRKGKVHKIWETL